MAQARYPQEQLFLPIYSHSLNLIERLGKLIKKVCFNRHYTTPHTSNSKPQSRKGLRWLTATISRPSTPPLRSTSRRSTTLNY
jgi:transposase